jgi:PTH1 family peptidyl-tRNA hydrolase
MIDFILIGLGNSGKAYEFTRHNVGFLFLEALYQYHNENHPDKSSPWSEKKLYTQSILIHYDLKVLLIKPTTFMNDSGLAAAQLSHFYKIPSRQIIVIQDDLDLKTAEFSFRWGGTGGHNGLKSIKQHIGNDYGRFRIGIGRPTHTSEVPHYVLNAFSQEEYILIKKVNDFLIENIFAALKKLKLCAVYNKNDHNCGQTFCTIMGGLYNKKNIFNK